MKRWMSFILPAMLLMAGCGSKTASASLAGVTPPAGTVHPGFESGRRTLNVFAAASLTDAFSELGKNFEAAHPGVTVAFNFAGSQTLRTQIEQGAPADVFASANNTEMNALVNEQKVQSGTPRIFLTNRLVVILPAQNPAGISSLDDLARPGLKLVLAAGSVPAGNYARQVLENLNASFGADYMDKVLANVVSNEDDVRQVVAKVELGEADAGVVYVSDAVAAPDLQRIEIPAGVTVIANYPIAAISGTLNPDLAAGFIDYVLSSAGQAILKKWGFTPIEP